MWKPRVIVNTDALSSRRYTIDSFFNAVHVTATRAMPSNRSLAEYIAIVTLLGKLISRLFNTLKVKGFSHNRISTSISLLVCQVDNEGDPLLSNATVGFSLCGGKKRRKPIICERKENLPVLHSINATSHQLDWEPGNCAEAETLAHLEFMHQSLGEIARRKDNLRPHTGDIENMEILSMCLTLKMPDKHTEDVTPMKGKTFCKFCLELTQKMSDNLSCTILDICPPQ